MAITFHASWEGRPVNAAARRARRLEQLVYAITDDPANTDGVDIADAIGDTWGVFIGTPHPNWPPALCTEIDPSPDPEDPSTWFVRLLYEEPTALPGTVPGVSGGPSGGGTGGSGGTPPEPAARDPMVTIRTQKVAVYEPLDLDGVAYVNTANDPLEDPPPRWISHAVISTTRWYTTYSTAAAANYANKVNLAVWNGYAADTLLVEQIDAKPKTEKGRAFWEVNWTLLWNPLGWIPTYILNVGRRQLQTVTLFKIPITDRTARELPGLSLLDINGEVTDTPFLLERRQYDRITFAGI